MPLAFGYPIVWYLKSRGKVIEGIREVLLSGLVKRHNCGCARATAHGDFQPIEVYWIS